mgnify:CR=1 FL=1
MKKRYELFSANNENGYTTISLSVDGKRLVLSDCSGGPMCEAFLGKEDWDYFMSFDKAAARKMLKYLKVRVAPSASPAEALAGCLVAKFAGDPDVTDRIRVMARKAGVEPEVESW